MTRADAEAVSRNVERQRETDGETGGETGGEEDRRILTQEGEGLASVGDSVGEDQRVPSLKHIFDQTLHCPVKHLSLGGLWTIHLERQQR